MRALQQSDQIRRAARACAGRRREHARHRALRTDRAQRRPISSSPCVRPQQGSELYALLTRSAQAVAYPLPSRRAEQSTGTRACISSGTVGLAARRFAGYMLCSERALYRLHHIAYRKELPVRGFYRARRQHRRHASRYYRLYSRSAARSRAVAARTAVRQPYKPGGEPRISLPQQRAVFP